jgi:hypothetical protein
MFDTVFFLGTLIALILSISGVITARGVDKEKGEKMLRWGRNTFIITSIVAFGLAFT